MPYRYVGGAPSTDEEVGERNIEYLKGVIEDLEKKKANAKTPEVIERLEQTIATLKKDIEA